MPPFFSGNPIFFVVMGLVVVVQIAIVQYGGAIFATVPLSAMQWLAIIIASSLVLVIGVILRVSCGLFRQRHDQRG
jgi:Ca2+-transporting ATPase